MDRPHFDVVPLVRDEPTHTYLWLPTMTVMTYSVSKVATLNKPYFGDPAAGVRGTFVHLCLEHFLKGLPQPEWGQYEPFIAPLLAKDYWQDFEPWIVEGMVCDLKKSVGGQFDILGFDHKRQKITVVDLKSTTSNTNKDHRIQLGGYVQMIADLHKVCVDECRIIWARPNDCELGEPKCAKDCSIKWSDQWDKFKTIRKLFSPNATPAAVQTPQIPRGTSPADYSFNPELVLQPD